MLPNGLNAIIISSYSNPFNSGRFDAMALGKTRNFHYFDMLPDKVNISTVSCCISYIYGHPL